MEDSYPKWLYHADAEPLLVKSEKQRVAIGAGWEESPVEAKKPEQKIIKKSESKDGGRA